MNQNVIETLVKNLKEEQEIRINSKGEIKLSWRNNDGKNKHINLGNFFEFISEAVPLKSKPFATPPLKGKISFYKFGTVLPKFDKKNLDNKKIQKWTMAFNMLKSLDFEPKKSTWTNNQIAVDYDVEELGGVKIYYFRGVARMVEFENERLFIPQLIDENREHGKNK